MGNDGGSIPDRRDLVRNKPKAEQADKANQTKARWFFCALSKRKLQEPVVSCALGKLYNKDAILEYLLNKQAYGDGERICGHIRSLKDVKTLKLTPNPVAPPPSTSTVTDDASPDIAPFVCPLTLKEMNGVQPFVYIATCGCVFSQAGLKTVAASIAPSANGNGNGKAKEKEKEGPSTPEEEEDTFNFNLCPQCQTKYSPKEDVIPLNPSEEDELKMRFAMERKRLAEPVASKKKSKKRKNPTTAAADGGPSLADDKEKEKEKGNAKESGEPPAKKLHTSSSSSHQTHIHAHPSHAHKHHTHSQSSTPPSGSHPSPHLNSHPHLAPSIAGSSRAVVEELAREEAKRKAGMSDAVKSLYGDGTSRRKETFMTMGTFTRYA